MSAGFVGHIATLLIWASFVCGFVGLGVVLLVKTLMGHSDEHYGAADDTPETISANRKENP